MSNPESMEYLNQARYFIGTGQYDDAMDLINKAIAIDKMNKELYVQKGIIYTNMDQYDAATEEFKKALKIDKSYAEAYFHLGNLSIMNEARNEGIEFYNKAMAYGYDDAQIFYNLGLMYEEDGNDELAVRNYTKAIMKDPLRVDARVRKAKIYISDGRQQEALETLNALILADPDLYDGYHLKALLLADMGKNDEALKLLDEAARLFPKDPEFLIDKINVYVMMNESATAKALVSTLESDYEMSGGQKRRLELEKARLYALDKDVDSIIKSLLKAKAYTQEIEPTNIDAEVTFLLANCYLDKKDYANAITCSRELIESSELTYSIPAYYTLPYAYAQSGDKEKANAQYVESIDKLRAITLSNPEILDGYLFRALCLKEVGQYDKALELAEYLLKVDENSKPFHNLKAEVLFAKGEQEAAKNEKALAEAIK